MVFDLADLIPGVPPPAKLSQIQTRQSGVGFEYITWRANSCLIPLRQLSYIMPFHQRAGG